MSDNVVQPAFSGRGWAEAERWVKAGHDPSVLVVDPEAGPAEASFAGFECRWQTVPSFRDHKLALIVVVTEADPVRNRAIYLGVLEQIRAIFGDVSAHHPLQASGMQLAFSPAALSHEYRVRSAAKACWGKIGNALALLLQNLAGVYLFSRGETRKPSHWHRYREQLVENSDFRKFDGALRMVIDASTSQIESFRHWLETARQSGELVYGMHTSAGALVTCLVESHRDKHVHFVDGSDGGYALAAKALKHQLAARAEGRSRKSTMGS